MSNGGRCCLLQICCRRAKSVAHITKSLTAKGVTARNAKIAAEWFADEIEAMGDLAAAVAEMKAAHPTPED